MRTFQCRIAITDELRDDLQFHVESYLMSKAKGQGVDFFRRHVYRKWTPPREHIKINDIRTAKTIEQADEKLTLYVIHVDLYLDPWG